MHEVPTTSFSIANYCEICRCLCRHCLLDSRYCATGVEYERGEALAARVFAEIKAERPELSTLFYAGYCMDLPQIGRYIRFTGNAFLQCNGMGMKSEREAEEWMRAAKDAGARLLDMTFYGVGGQHDAFAGRKGDFEYLLLLIDCAHRAGLDVEASVALTRTNMEQMPKLYALLGAHGVEKTHVFLSHAKGRGIDLTDERLTDEDFERLCPQAKEHFSKIPHKTEAEWIARATMAPASSSDALPRATDSNVTAGVTSASAPSSDALPRATDSNVTAGVTSASAPSSGAFPRATDSNVTAGVTSASAPSSDAFPRATGRNVTLVLTPDNIEKYEKMPAAAIVSELEEMDGAFYRAIPGPEELARLVGKPENRQIFRFRDLYLEWQKRYMAQTGLKIYDMNDERHSFSVRMYAEREAVG